MKLVKEYINEKFTQDSDPIKDMRIGEPAYAVLNKIPKQDRNDRSMFSINLSDGEEVTAMGEEFCSYLFNLSLDEMIKFIDKGIKKILKIPKKKLTSKDLGDYSDFFEAEFNYV